MVPSSIQSWTSSAGGHDSATASEQRCECTHSSTLQYYSTMSSRPRHSLLAHCRCTIIARPYANLHYSLGSTAVIRIPDNFCKPENRYSERSSSRIKLGSTCPFRFGCIIHRSGVHYLAPHSRISFHAAELRSAIDWIRRS